MLFGYNLETIRSACAGVGGQSNASDADSNPFATCTSAFSLLKPVRASKCKCNCKPKTRPIVASRTSGHQIRQANSKRQADRPNRSMYALATIFACLLMIFAIKSVKLERLADERAQIKAPDTRRVTGDTSDTAEPKQTSTNDASPLNNKTQESFADNINTSPKRFEAPNEWRQDHELRGVVLGRQLMGQLIQQFLTRTQRDLAQTEASSIFLAVNESQSQSYERPQVDSESALADHFYPSDTLQQNGGLMDKPIISANINERSEPTLNADTEPIEPSDLLATEDTSKDSEDKNVTSVCVFPNRTLNDSFDKTNSSQKEDILKQVESVTSFSNATVFVYYNYGKNEIVDLTRWPPEPPTMVRVITQVITPAIFSIIIIVGLIGNIAVILVILEDRKTERELTPPNLLILDLSLADLSFIIFCIPFTAWDYSVSHWVFGELWCQLNQYLIVVCALSSIYTLALMSLDRFMAIVYPIECLSYRTSKNTLYAISLKWIIILSLASPAIRMHKTRIIPCTLLYVCRFNEENYDPLQFQIVFFIASYLFPLVLIFCLYVSLLNKLWFGSKPHGHKESSKMLESKRKVTWLVASIVIVFAICWCPIQVMLILMRLGKHEETAIYLAIQVFAHTLGYMNSCINPIVYAFASENFHNSFKRSSLGHFCRHCIPCLGSPHEGNDRTTTTVSALNYHNQAHSVPGNHFSSSIRYKNRSTKSNQLKVDEIKGRVSLPNMVQIPETSLCLETVESSNVKNNREPSILNPPLEPRDRHEFPNPTLTREPANDSNAVQGHDIRTVKSDDISQSARSFASASMASKSSSQPTKQQLVAQVNQTNSNQISHRCEPIFEP